MRISSTIFLTLDGVYQGPGGPDEDRRGGFGQGGWTVPFSDADFGEFISGVFERADAFLLGRRTYDIFAGYWPKVTDPDNPVASRLNSLPKYVVTSTPIESDWVGTQVLRGDTAMKDIAALRERPGRELQVHGSGRLVRSLLDEGLLDTLHVVTSPVVLGDGMRLFAPGSRPTRFGLGASRTTSTGVVITSYHRAGDPEYGSF
jgi:dihydrofolate reductase